MQNVQNQNQAAIDNNPLAQLMIGYVFETLAGKPGSANAGPLKYPPERLLQDLQSYDAKYGLFCPCCGMRLRHSPVNKRDRNRLREIHTLEQLGQVYMLI
jgi:hypothetical protein